MNTCLFSLSLTTHEFVYSAHQIIHLLSFLHLLNELQRRSDNAKKEPQLLNRKNHPCDVKFERKCKLDVLEEIYGWNLRKKETSEKETEQLRSHIEHAAS